jgi:hypothetical protein
MPSAALHLAQLCEASYDPNDPRFREAKDMRFGVIEGNLVIRGTANTRNVWRDITALPWQSRSGGAVHYGFAHAAEKVRSALTSAEVAAIRGASGHSLGGAAALLLARELQVPVVTFGCPRLDFRWCAPTLTKHDRYVCDDDPVPMIPRFLYTHQAEPIILADRDGGIDVKDHGIAVYVRRLGLRAAGAGA